MPALHDSPSPTSSTVLGRALRPAGARALAGLLFALVSVPLLAGCSDKGRRLSPKEVLDYKRELVREHHQELTPAQQTELMYYQGWTKAELDAALEERVARFHEMRRRDEAKLREGLENVPEAPGGAGGSGAGASGDGGAGAEGTESAGDA